jgi:type II secretory pathway component GspD/PulD (secretin)
MEGVDFFTALREAMSVAHAFWVPLTPKQVIVFNDTQALRRQYERTTSATFYLSDATSPQELTEVVSLLRTLFDVRFAVAQPSNNSVVIRAPGATVEAAEKVLDNVLSRKPQVTLNVQVYAVSETLMRALGISEPTQFQAINVGLAALSLLGQGNVQNLINQLIASGGINSANSTALQSLLSQLQNQQSSSLLQTLSQTPFATFGGGKTLFAVPFSGITGTAQLNTSDLESVQSVILRAAQGNAATLKIGERYPVLNASFAPIYNTPAISQVIQNGSYQAPFPSVSYEDLGLDLKVTPQVLADSTINLKVELQIKALAGQSINGVPVLSNREYTATMSVLDGTTTAVAGMITESEQKNLSGLPGFSAVPGFGALASTTNKSIDYEELLIVITPTIVSPAKSNADGVEVWMAGG